MLSTEPGNLFGYERLVFDADVRYDERSSAESGVDASQQQRRRELAPELRTHRRRLR